MFKLQDTYIRKRPLLNRIQLNQYYSNKSDFLNLNSNFFNKIGLSKGYILSSIYLSSPFFLKEFLRYEDLPRKRQLKVIDSLDNYFNRMTFKAAPFGLFSVIAIMNFKNKEGEQSDFHSAIYPSNEWLLKLIKKVEKLQLDSLILEKGKKISIGKQTIEVCLGSEKYIVYNNEVLNTLLSEIKTPIIYRDLKKKILNKVIINEKDLDDMVKTLLDYEIVITNIKKSTSELTVIRELIKEKDLKEKVSKLISEFEYINTSDINLENLINIEKRMKELVESNSYINGEAITNKDSISNLKYGDFEELNKILPLLLPRLSEEYQTYELDFIEKFGEENRIPLLAVIESLGAFSNSKFVYDYKPFENLIINKIFSGGLDKANVELVDEDISSILTKGNIEEINGFEITLNYYKDLINLDTGINIKGLGSFEGRFKNINSINAPKLKKINYKSNDETLNNILDINGQISLHQIDVIYTRKSIRLIDSNSNHEIAINKNNMVDPKYFPKEINTIYELSNNLDYSLQRELFPNSVYKIPRVTYKNIVLVLGSWNFAEYLKVKGVENKGDFKEKFKRFVNDYKVPNRIIYMDGDYKRPLNTGVEQEIENLYKEYTLGKKIILKEDFFETNVEYNDEYVLRFLNSSSLETNVNYNKRNISRDNKLKTMNAGWLYLEIELKEIFFDSFLNSLNKLISTKNIQFYYIKYKNNFNDSLRIRFRKALELNNYEFNKVVFDSLDTLNDKFEIGGLEIKNYVQEKMLYDQNNNFDIIEDFFVKESDFIINNLKREIENINDDSDILVIQVLYLYHIVKITEVEGYILDRYQPGREDQKNYRTLKGDLLNLVVNKPDVENKFYSANNKIHFFLNNNLNLFHSLKNENDYIILKILHLSFNRINGTEKILEERILNLVSLLIKTVSKVR